MGGNLSRVGAAFRSIHSPDSPVSMDSSDDLISPGLVAGEEDDSHQVFGHFDADENADAEEEENVSDLQPASPVAENQLSESDPVQNDDQDEEEGTAALPDDGLIDSDDEEIKKLEAEANAPDEADDDEQEVSSAPPQKTADGQLIADIFGDSDSEDEGFEGFNREAAEESKVGTESGVAADPAGSQDGSSDDEDDEDGKNRNRSDIVYDFDLMMQKKREENYRRRKRKNTDIINDSDDLIADMITQMKQAAEDDFEYNKVRRPATCKLKLLPRIEDPLRKIDLREALLDSGILSVITDWLTPLPDRSLPNIHVREVMLQILLDFNISDTDRLKASGVGKAVMYLYKHPRETKENKVRSHRLIQAWSRPIFNNDVDFHSMTKEEREERDKRLIERSRESNSKRARTESPVKKPAEKAPAPGEKGWVPRARVPQPSARDYVNRPRSSAEVDIGGSRGSGKKIVTRYEMMQRTFNEKKKSTKMTGAIKVSIEGRKM